MADIANNEQVMLEEWDRFQVKLPELSKTLHRKWVAFKDDQVVSVHEDEDEAFEAAVARFGPGVPFIVAQVATQNPALVLFGP